MPGQATPSRRRVKVETGITRRLNATGEREGVYYVRAKVNGRLVERTAPTLREARVIRGELRTDPRKARVDPRLTLREYADRWLK